MGWSEVSGAPIRAPEMRVCLMYVFRNACIAREHMPRVERASRRLVLAQERGWGNSFNSIKVLFELAAAIGRRPLLHVHTSAYLPNEVLALGARVSWNLPSPPTYVTQGVLSSEA